MQVDHQDRTCNLCHDWSGSVIQDRTQGKCQILFLLECIPRHSNLNKRNYKYQLKSFWWHCSPKCHFPTICVLYPSCLSSLGNVVRFNISPVGCNGFKALFCLPMWKGYLPVRRAALEGVQTCWLYAWSSLIPSWDNFSMLAVGMSALCQDTSFQPRSSARMKITFGFLFSSHPTPTTNNNTLVQAFMIELLSRWPCLW